MTGHKANVKDSAGFVINRGGSDVPAQPEQARPATLTLIFGNPNNDMTRRMMIQIMPGQQVDVAFGTFPLTIIRED